MSNNLFEILLNLFEKSLVQLQKRHPSMNNSLEFIHVEEEPSLEDQTLHIKSPQYQSTRVLINEERVKLTKSSYQFLMRIKLWGIIDADLFELIMNQLYCSDSRIITLEETKWTIRNILAHNLSDEELAFLDLVLYQKEDALTCH